MAVDIKVAPDEKLELVQTYITDTSLNSDYFNISELPDTFSGGKNAFLIAGSTKLLANTEVKIQIKDSLGNIVYTEYSHGTPSEYYEGNSKICAVYVYPTLTAFGPATITILGQLKDAPPEWNGLFSVKWTKQVNINPALANTTRVRFYKRPQVQIKELLQPLYSIVSGSKVASLVTQSFANITINQLETFAGDVARVKVYRTSVGDISDYDLIQDISIESKNLLTTYALTGSVVGNAGIFGPDSLKKVWNTSSLHAVLDSTYIEDGLQLTGSGTFTFTSSLSLLSSNTYELELDAFYTGSTTTNLVAYISGSGSAIYPITTFNGSIPTKNFGTTTIPFTITNDAPTASLYFSQSSGTNQWHIGNISLNLSQDTAFSPNEISFITSMPTVLGNETFNFKFEFYDINNNYVPVAVTQSALFNGGNNNIGGTLILISGSVSASEASILALSQSVSGTIGTVTGSISQSFVTSSAYSASLQSSSLYISASLSSSISSSISTSVALVSASISSSVANLSQSVYAYQTYLDGNIFTDSTGKLIKTPATGSNQSGLYTGQEYLGFYSGSRWRTFMGNTGNFYLTSSVVGGGFMAWDASAASLAIAGNITILGGDAATTSSVTTAVNSGTASLSSSIAPNIFTDSTGKIVRPPVNTASNYGLYLGSSNLGFYSGSSWRTYMDNSGNFYLTGSASNYLKWNGSVLTIAGAIDITGGTASDKINGAASSGSNALAYAIANNATASVAAVDAKVFTDATGKLSKTPSTSASGLYLGSTYLGYYNGSDWKTYMANNGNFYLSGVGSNNLSWNGSSLTINGSITTTDATIGGWSIDSTRIYSTNGITLDSANKQITVFDAAGAGRIYINQNTTLSSLSAGSPQLGFYFGSNDTGTISEGTYEHLSPNTFILTAGKTWNLKAVFTDANNTTGVTINSGQGTPQSIDIWERCYVRKTTSPYTEYLIAEYKDGVSLTSTTVLLAAINNKQNSITIPGDGGTYELISRVTWQAAGAYNSGVYTASTLRFSAFDFTASPANSFVEIVAGGLQVGRDGNNYVKIDRAAASGTMLEVGGDITATGNITAYYSDKRLKKNIIKIDNPLLKLLKLKGVYYNQNELAEKFGFKQDERQVGVLAQDVEEVLPEAVCIAPFDNDGNGNSKSGETYLTVKYEKIVPLLIECIKQLQLEIQELKDNK
jgi:hypothetical protein